jgi:hypothetical protein
MSMIITLGNRQSAAAVGYCKSNQTRGPFPSEARLRWMLRTGMGDAVVRIGQWQEAAGGRGAVQVDTRTCAAARVGGVE